MQDLPITHFICRTERILAQMPFLNKSICLAAITSCVIGTCCAQLNAQTSSGTPRKSTSGTGTTKSQAAGRATVGPAQKVAGAPAPVQAGRPAQGAVRQPLPQAQPFRIPKLSPEMEDILVEWEEKSSKIQRLEGSFTRRTYDGVFQVEKLSEGRYCFAFPDLGSFEQHGASIKKGEKGRRYTLTPGADERWVCDGARIVKIEEKEKQYQEIPIPPEDRGQNIRNSPLPFLFGMKASEAKRRYAFELNEKKTNQQIIWLTVHPLLQQDLANYKKAEVVLNRENCLPIGVRLYDTTGNQEDEYFFNQSEMTVNGRTWARFFTGRDPLKPDLRSYKKIIQNENAAGPAGQQLAQPPAGRRNASLQSIQPAGSKVQGPLPQRTAQLPDDDEPPARATTRQRVQP